MRVISVIATGIYVVMASAVIFAESPEQQQMPEGQVKGGDVGTAPGRELEKYADEAGQIYVTRGYKGVVPGVRDEPAVPSKLKTKEVDTVVVQWVGFQPFTTYSRVFIQVEGRYAFTVTKPKPLEIEVRIPDAVVSSSNDLRHLVTRAFPTAVDRVLIEAPHEGLDAVVVRIVLKRPVAYLYRSEGKYIFIDLEM